MRLVAIATLVLAGVVAAAFWLWPRIVLAFSTVSTDDAYVAGHVTYVAPRVAGTVLKVHVDDNQAVTAGQLLVELDPEPYQIVVDRAAASLKAAEAQVGQARTQGRAVVAGIRAAWSNVRLAMDQVTEQIEKLKASVATRDKAVAERALAEAELRRARNLFQANSGTQQVVDQREASYQVAAASEREAHQQIFLNRAALGLTPIPPADQPLQGVSDDLKMRVPVVRAALAELINTAVKIGIQIPPIEEDPETVYNNFVSRAPGGDLDRYLNELVEGSPAVAIARAGVEQAARALDQAKLDLRDTRITASLSGLIGRRLVNPGNRVQAGQGLMALRSLEDVWIDANFKETQLADLQIGQEVEILADAYPGRSYRGRISGFGAGTGASTALLPPENATGNFVKVVQRLPVRIDLTDGNPSDAPLFIGLSVEPRVYIRRAPSGPFAGQKLRRPVESPTPEGRDAAIPRGGNPPP
ncbi:MAG: efflux RND transporter periplasmic adaptor subunit [Isosphaeraceae bacterium]